MEIDIEYRFETLHWSRKENQRARTVKAAFYFLVNRDPHD